MGVDLEIIEKAGPGTPLMGSASVRDGRTSRHFFWIILTCLTKFNSRCGKNLALRSMPLLLPEHNLKNNRN